MKSLVCLHYLMIYGLFLASGYAQPPCRLDLVQACLGHLQDGNKIAFLKTILEHKIQFSTVFPHCYFQSLIANQPDIAQWLCERLGVQDQSDFDLFNGYNFSFLIDKNTQDLELIMPCLLKNLRYGDEPNLLMVAMRRLMQLHEALDPEQTTEEDVSFHTTSSEDASNTDDETQSQDGSIGDDDASEEAYSSAEEDTASNEDDQSSRSSSSSSALSASSSCSEVESFEESSAAQTSSSSSHQGNLLLWQQKILMITQYINPDVWMQTNEHQESAMNWVREYPLFSFLVNRMPRY